MTWEKGTGLEFLARRMNVSLKLREIRSGRLVKPLEYYMLQEIELGTVGAENPKKRICSKGAFYLEDLSKHLNILINKVYVTLRSLEKKELIIREKTRSKGLEILGLNPNFFGQVLIDTSHIRETKSHLKLVKNNPNLVQKEDKVSPDLGANKSQNRTDQVLNRDQTRSQVIDNKEENLPLESLEGLNILEGKTEESFTLSGSETDREKAAKARAYLNKKFPKGVMGLVKNI